MSTFTFLVRLPETPSDDDLVRMKATRALLESVTGLQSTSGTFSIDGNKRSNKESVHCDIIPRKWLHEASVLVQGGLISGYEHYGEIEPEEKPMSEEVERWSKLDAKIILNRLNRLLDIYRHQAQRSRDMVRDGVDVQSVSLHFISTLRYEAKCEAILEVAGNLEIELEEPK